MKTVPCAGCRAPLIWRWTPGDKRMPLNVDPVSPAQGTYVIVDNDYCRPSEPMFDGPEVEHRMNHWATCPRSQEFKR